MTHEKHSPNPEMMKQVMRQLQVRMRNNALHHIGKIGPRTLRILQDLDLFDDKVEQLAANVNPDILRDPKHQLRKPLPTGPLVLYLNQHDQPQRTVVELPFLVFADSREIRQATVENIKRLISEDEYSSTPKTKHIINEHLVDLISNDPSKWRPASVAISDALYDDVLVALAGTRQSLECEPVLQQSLNFYAPKVLHPSVTSLDSIELPAGKGERDRDVLKKLIADISTHSTTVAELCDNYLQKLGFMPLAPAYSMAAAISRWVEANKKEDVWDSVWAWADQATTPLAIYHACGVFVLHPDLIPDGKLSALWGKIISAVSVHANNSEESLPQEPWALRRDLAKHFTYHLEARLPDNDGASINAFAWWFAERVAGLFPKDASSAKFYRENWIKPATELSSHVWLTAGSPVQNSFLRYITLTVSSPWAVALLVLMGEKFESLAADQQDDATKSLFQEAVVSHSLTCIPLPSNKPKEPMFAQECSMADTILKWAELQDATNKAALHQLVHMNSGLDTADGLCKALRKLRDMSLVDQFAVCISLKAKALIDPSIGKALWEVASDSVWRKSTLAAAESQQVQGLLIESMSLLLVHNRDDWFVRLPHFIAELCENTEDPDRRRELFLYVLHLSMASDTVSAVRRLLTGEHKAKFVEFVTEYRKHAEAGRANYPPWVAAKLRGLMASLHIG